jgi:hypothetical protein
VAEGASEGDAVILLASSASQGRVALSTFSAGAVYASGVWPDALVSCSNARGPEYSRCALLVGLALLHLLIWLENAAGPAEEPARSPSPKSIFEPWLSGRGFPPTLFC